MSDAREKEKNRNSPERGNLRDAFGVRLVSGAHARLVSGGTRVTGFPFVSGFVRVLYAPRLFSGPRTARAPRTRWSARSACFPRSPCAECSRGGSTCCDLSLAVLVLSSNPAGASVTSRRLRRAAGCVSGGQRVNFGGGREERTVGAFERVRGASSRAPEPGPGRSRLEKRASAKRETLVSD